MRTESAFKWMASFLLLGLFGLLCLVVYSMADASKEHTAQGIVTVLGGPLDAQP